MHGVEPMTEQTNIFLVTGYTITREYMRDYETRGSIIRIVIADNADDAYAKFTSALTIDDPYGINTAAYVDDVSRAIT
jgi:hypothetical protein